MNVCLWSFEWSLCHTKIEFWNVWTQFQVSIFLKIDSVLLSCTESKMFLADVIWWVNECEKLWWIRKLQSCLKVLKSANARDRSFFKISSSFVSFVFNRLDDKSEFPHVDSLLMHWIMVDLCLYCILHLCFQKQSPEVFYRNRHS